MGYVQFQEGNHEIHSKPQIIENLPNELMLLIFGMSSKVKPPLDLSARPEDLAHGQGGPRFFQPFPVVDVSGGPKRLDPTLGWFRKLPPWLVREDLQGWNFDTPEITSDNDIFLLQKVEVKSLLWKLHHSMPSNLTWAQVVLMENVRVDV